MKFRTVIDIPESPFQISHSDRIFSIGSCFAVHTGNYLEETGFRVSVNPFGTLFNSASVLKMLRRTINREQPASDELFCSEKMFKHYDFPGLFNRYDKKSYLDNAKETLETQRVFLKKASIVLLTLGTAQVWILKETGQVVANCHKQPQALFERRMQSIESVVADLEAIFSLLRKMHPGIRMVLSISPVRYLQDGYTANARSKARLLEAVLTFRDRYPERVYYFPAYEIFNDDLRDYRFYAADLKHPGEQGIAYVLEKFSDTFFDGPTLEIIRKVEKFKRLQNHRPIAGDSSEHDALVRSEAERLKQAYPFLNLKSV